MPQRDQFTYRKRASIGCALFELQSTPNVSDAAVECQYAHRYGGETRFSQT
jgi:hypothetical protein